MKFIKKVSIHILVLCICITTIFHYTIVVTSAEDNVTTTPTREDVIAGIASPSQVDLELSRATSENAVIANGTYYINGEYSGDYLRNSASSVVAKSGTFSSLGASIRWIITNDSGSFTIRSASDTTKYLAVPTSSTTSSSVELVTLSSTTIPTECLWNISYADNGGCIIQSVYNTRYLYSYGDTVSTTTILGSPEYSLYNKRVWRIAELSYISGKELTSNTVFHNCHLLMGYDANLKYRTAPNNAIWADADDFVFSGYSSVMTIDSNGKISPVAIGETTVTCTHKVTDKVFTVRVRVWQEKNNLGPISYWADIESNFVGHWTSDPAVYKEKLDSDASFYFLNGVSSAISEWNTALGTNIFTTTSESNADIVIYGGTTSELAALGYTLSSSHVGYTSWNYSYIGHYTYRNSVKLGAELNNATILIKSISGKTANGYINTCTHELGHTLGFFGHASSTSAVMYAFDHTGYTLQTAEKNHMAQVYD